MNGGAEPRSNSRGKTFFESKGVTVGADGVIPNGPGFLAALNALRAIQTFDDMKRGTLDAMTYLVSFGLTTASTWAPSRFPHARYAGRPRRGQRREPEPWTMYDAFSGAEPRRQTDASAEDVLPHAGYASRRADPEAAPDNTALGLGDDMLKTAGIGEFGAAWRFQGGATPANYETALQLVAKHGWPFSSTRCRSTKISSRRARSKR